MIGFIRQVVYDIWEIFRVGRGEFLESRAFSIAPHSAILAMFLADLSLISIPIYALIACYGKNSSHFISF